MVRNTNLWHQRDFLAEAISMTFYLVNRSPYCSIDFKIPEEVWSGNPVNYFILRVAYARVSNRK